MTPNEYEIYLLYRNNTDKRNEAALLEWERKWRYGGDQQQIEEALNVD